MRKLFYLFMVAMCATMFTACSDDDDKDPLDDDGEGKEGVITMTTEETYIHLGVETFNEGEIITIDWGDGSKEEFKSFGIIYEDENGKEKIYYTIGNDEDYEDKIRHVYPDDKLYTITIKGKIKEFSAEYGLNSLDVSKCPALTWLNCESNNLTSLDVSKNTALTYLICSSNNLTSLDVSKNTALTCLECSGNNLTSAALNQIFRDLPQVTSGTIYMSGNPGTETCDKSIAENKGWRVM